MRLRPLSSACLSALLALALVSCGPAVSPAPEMPPPPAPPPATAVEAPGAPELEPEPASTAKIVSAPLESVGLDPAAMDRSVSPCDDFYRFSCGGWMKTAEIPGDEPGWSRSFDEIQKRNELELRRILDEASKDKSKDPLVQKIGGYYGACMDEPAAEAAGYKPIKPLLAKALAVRDPKGVAALTTELHAAGIWPLFDISASQDFEDATRWVSNLDQGGLGLPDRDYYLREDDKSKALRADYVAHVQRMLELAGIPQARATSAAADVMSIETELAKVSKTNVERRNPKGLFNRVDRAGLAKLAPDFGWDGYFKGLGFPGMSALNVTSPKFFEGVGKLLGSVKPEAWQSYLAWHVVHGTSRSLSKAFVDESFKMEQALTGQKDQRPRWKRCVASTDDALGELLAQPYLKTSFPGDSKKAAEEMVAQVSRAFGNEVGKLDWMDAKTKQRSLAKLQSMAYLIGYPARWKSYDFRIDRKAHIKNVLASRAFELKRSLAKVGKPVDREEWQMTPPTVNAYYDAQHNHMVFPAGILQPPFYSVKANIPVNLGGMGMVVGHELTHGFDDEGSQFDASGNLVNWWEPEVAVSFKAKTACVATQFNAYEPLPGLKVNGELTLGENIADLGGVKLAFRAYRSMRKDAAEVTLAGGFSEDQQFFLSFAQSWCGKFREDFERLLVQTNPHSPMKFRVNGPLSNSPEFARAFSCKVGTPMRPAKTCSVW